MRGSYSAWVVTGSQSWRRLTPGCTSPWRAKALSISQHVVADPDQSTGHTRPLASGRAKNPSRPSRGREATDARPSNTLVSEGSLIPV